MNVTIALSRFHRFEKGRKAKPKTDREYEYANVALICNIPSNAVLTQSLTGLLLGSLFGGVLPLLADDGQSGEVGPGLLRLPLRVQLLVSLLGLLLLNLFPLAAGQLRLRSGANLFDLNSEDI